MHKVTWFDKWLDTGFLPLFLGGIGLLILLATLSAGVKYGKRTAEVKCLEGWIKGDCICQCRGEQDER